MPDVKRAMIIGLDCAEPSLVLGRFREPAPEVRELVERAADEVERKVLESRGDADAGGERQTGDADAGGERQTGSEAKTDGER